MIDLAQEIALEEEALRAGTWILVPDSLGQSDGDYWWLLHKNYAKAAIRRLSEDFAPLRQVLSALAETGVEPNYTHTLVHNCWFACIRRGREHDQDLIRLEEELAMQLAEHMLSTLTVALHQSVSSERLGDVVKPLREYSDD